MDATMTGLLASPVRPRVLTPAKRRRRTGSGPANRRIGRPRDRAIPPNDKAVGQCAWATKINGRIVGMISVSRSAGQVAKIDELRIDPKWQHTKVLTELIRHVEEYCVSEGGLQLRIEAGSMPGWILSHFGNYHRP
jgi:hypothetical protein